MRIRTPSRTVGRLGAALGAIALASVAAPALAQVVYTEPEVVVPGPRPGPDGRPETLSRVVSIRDLDLRYDRDVREMRRRVRATARDLCDELGEGGGYSPIGGSCVDNAVRSADRQMRVAINQSRSYYAYAPPPSYAGAYAPPASAVVPYDPDAYAPPPDL